jgi:hypothetical protein
MWVGDQLAVSDEGVGVRPGWQIHDDPPVTADALQKVDPRVPIVETANESHRPGNPRSITEQDRVYIRIHREPPRRSRLESTSKSPTIKEVYGKCFPGRSETFWEPTLCFRTIARTVDS